MATVSSTTGTTGNEYLASLGTNNSSSASVTDQIQDRFLKLLTTQLRNQDPLNPLDNAQMTSQLAQINTISGIEKMNATLGKMLDFYNAGQGMQAAGLIGKYVLVAGNNLTLANGQSAGGVLLKEAADQVTVSVPEMWFRRSSSALTTPVTWPLAGMARSRMVRRCLPGTTASVSRRYVATAR